MYQNADVMIDEEILRSKPPRCSPSYNRRLVEEKKNPIHYICTRFIDDLKFKAGKFVINNFIRYERRSNSIKESKTEQIHYHTKINNNNKD